VGAISCIFPYALSSKNMRTMMIMTTHLDLVSRDTNSKVQKVLDTFLNIIIIIIIIMVMVLGRTLFE
jgi:hypothetical protein